MNTIKKILIAIGGGIDAVFYIMTPIFIALFLNIIGILMEAEQGKWSSIIFLLGIFATLFRGYKIGWLNKYE